MCALAGAYLSLIYTPLWAQGMSAGRGWIVLALVVFASWRPLRLLAGALLFGFLSILNFSLQNWGIAHRPAVFGDGALYCNHRGINFNIMEPPPPQK